MDLGFVGQKISKVERLERQVEALEKVNLGYLDLEQKIYTLSGERLNELPLRRLFWKIHPWFLADEPTAALDPENSEEVMNLLVGLKDENRMIIIATHNPLVWNKADEIIDMRELAHVWKNPYSQGIWLS